MAKQIPSVHARVTHSRMNTRVAEDSLYDEATGPRPSVRIANPWGRGMRVGTPVSTVNEVYEAEKRKAELDEAGVTGPKTLKTRKMTPEEMADWDARHGKGDK